MDRAILKSYMTDYLRVQVLPSFNSAKLRKLRGWTAATPSDLLPGVMWMGIDVDGEIFSVVGMAPLPDCPGEFAVLEHNATGAIAMSTWKRIKKGEWECTGAERDAVF